MTAAEETTIRFRVDPTNPGQFFACCGLLELADRLRNGVEGWFADDYFCIKSDDVAMSLSQLLTNVQQIKIAGTVSISENDDDEDYEGDRENEFLPLLIESPISLRLDWWQDKSLKTWAGSMDERKIFLAMCRAVEPHQDDPLNLKKVVFDSVPGDAGAGKKRAKKTKKREPFYFDGRRGANAWSIDVGFSSDSLKMTTVAYPVVEALCFIGLQRCRPRPTDTPRVFEYFTWHRPLSVVLAPVAISGHIGNGNGFRFENAFRTDQKKHKAFNPATPLKRS